jgi:hypothetical protein
MRGWGSLTLCLLSAGVARAAELRTTANASTYWSSDAPNSGTTEEEDAVRMDTGGGLELSSDPGARSSWRIGYQPTYEAYLTDHEGLVTTRTEQNGSIVTTLEPVTLDLDSWRHRAYASFEYPIDRHTRVSGRGNFSRSIRTNLVEDVLVDPTPVGAEADLQGEYVDTGSLDVTLSHTFTPRLSVSATSRYVRTDYERPDLSDFESTSAGGSVFYRVDARQTLGVGISLARQIVKQGDILTGQDPIETDSEQETRFASLYGSWSYALSPLWSLEMRAGPTLIDSDLQDVSTDPIQGLRVPVVQLANGQNRVLDATTCAPLEQGEVFEATGEAFLLNRGCALLPFTSFVNEGITYEFSNPDELTSQNQSDTLFADFGIARTGERTRFQLSYVRSAGENFGGRTSTISDVLSSSFNWQLTARNAIDVRGSYSVQQSATENAVPVVAYVRNNGTIPGLPDDAAIAGLFGAGSGEIVALSRDDLFEVETWTATVRFSRRFSSQLSGFVVGSYFDQQNRRASAGSVFQNQDRVEIGVGFTYAFRPIRL